LWIGLGDEEMTEIWQGEIKGIYIICVPAHTKGTAELAKHLTLEGDALHVPGQDESCVSIT
jgi:hypothetical protein